MSIAATPNWQIHLLMSLERLSGLGIPVDTNDKGIDYCKVYIDFNCSVINRQPLPLEGSVYLKMVGAASAVDGRDHLTIQPHLGRDQQAFEQAADEVIQRYDPESDCYYNEYEGSTALIEQTQRYFDHLVAQVEQIASRCTPEQLQAHKEIDALNGILQSPFYEWAMRDAHNADFYLQTSVEALAGNSEARYYAGYFLSTVQSAAHQIDACYQFQGRPPADLSTPTQQWKLVKDFADYAKQRMGQLNALIVQSADALSLQSRSAPQDSSDAPASPASSAEVNAPVNPISQQGDSSMSTEILETQTEAKPKKSRSKKAPVQEAPEAPTAETVLTSDVEAILNAIEQTPEAPTQEAPAPETPDKPAYDLEMSLFKGGANLFLKEENREAATQIAAALGVEVKSTKHGNPYMTVTAEQIDQALDLAKASGLSTDDARPRAAERAEAKAEARKEAYAEKAKAQEALRFEGAGSLLIQASLQLMKSGQTFVPGKELNVYQTKESQAEQSQIAEARAQGKDVKEQPIEIGVYDKRTQTVIAKGTVGRDDKGQLQVEVSLDQIAKANRERPDNLQIKPPTRTEVIERLDKYVRQRAEIAASKPVLKAKADAGR